MAISNCFFSPTYENPRGFSIRFVLANLVAETRNEIRLHLSLDYKTPNMVYKLSALFNFNL